MFKSLIAAAIALANPSPNPPPLTVAEQAQLRDNLHRGELLYRYDQDAWHTSDAMVEHLPEAQRSQIKGWVVTPAALADRTTYFEIDAGKPYVVYSATWNGSKVANEILPAVGEKRPLSDEESRLAEALITAMREAGQLGRCSASPFNVVVLPRSDRDHPDSVYFLTPQTAEGTYPLGGHHRFDVKDGKIISRREFTKSCIDLSTEAKRGERPVALGITHLLDEIPTEIHVFGMFATRTPIVVIVSDGRTFTLYADRGNARARLDVPGQ